MYSTTIKFNASYPGRHSDSVPLKKTGPLYFTSSKNAPTKMRYLTNSYMLCRHSYPNLSNSAHMFKDNVEKYWGIIVLLAWGGLAIALSMLRFDPYGIDEAAARALLVNWSVADRIISPIVTLGAPDLRAVFFLPLGAYWSGSFVALKVFIALLLFSAVVYLYRWCRSIHGDEPALIAAGLILLAPLTFSQINSVGVGPFLLLCFGLGRWLNHAYRVRGKQMGGWYFTQLLLVVTVVTIHPAGLAYPLALALEWKTNPTDDNKRKQMLIGVALAAIFAIVFRFGWPALEWGINPLVSLAAVISPIIPGALHATEWTTGLLPALALLMALFFSRKTIMQDFMSRMMVIALVIGLVAADHGWALIALCIILFMGVPALIQANNNLGAHSFAGQRGIVMVVIFLTATLFMVGDRSYRGGVIGGAVSAQDEIIRSLTLETLDIDKSFNTISQWPARTMLALKHPVFPLPPEAESSEEFYKMIGKIAFIVFDPFDPANKSLRDNIANSTDTMETLIQQPNGVIVKVKEFVPHTDN